MRQQVRPGAPDRSLTANAGLAAVTKLCGRLGVIEALDKAVGPVKQRDRGFGAGELLTGIAAAQLAGEDFLTGLDRQRADAAGQQLTPVPGLASTAEPETKVQPIPQLQPPAGPEGRPGPSPADRPAPARTAARPVVTRLPAWRRYRGRLSAVAAVAAAIITAAIVLPLSFGGGRITPARATAVIPLHATTAARLHGYGAATGRATGRQDASGSWTISLTVTHLKSFGDSQWYTCWYVSRNGQVASAGTFQVRDSGSWTFPMTSAADPHDFRTMEITLGPPSKNGELAGPVILRGQTL
jgi:anti-sigma-K factor RskA